MSAEHRAMDFTARIPAVPAPASAPAAIAPVGGLDAHARGPAGIGPQQVEDRVDILDLSPPQEVLDAIDRAAERVQELIDQQRRLHFFMDDASSRVIIEVQDHEGTVLRTIPPSHALDVMSGAEVK